MTQGFGGSREGPTSSSMVFTRTTFYYRSRRTPRNRRWTDFLDQLDQDDLSELDFYKSYITNFDLAGLTAPQLLHAVRETLKEHMSPRILEDELSSLNCPTSLRLRIQQLDLDEKKYLLDQVLARIHHDCAAALSSIWYDLDKKAVCIVWPSRGPDEVPHEKLQAAICLVADKTGYTLAEGCVYTLFEAMTRQISSACYSVVVRHLSTSNLVARPRRRQDQNTSEPRLDECSRLVTDILHELRQEDERICVFADRIEDIARHGQFLVMIHYEREIDHLVGQDWIRPDSTKTVDEIVQYSATLARPPDIPRLIEESHYFDLIWLKQHSGPSLPQGRWKPGTKKKCPSHPPGRHSRFVERYLRQQYGNYLAQSPNRYMLPLTPSKPTFPAEISIQILNHVLPTRVTLPSPESILGNQWTFRTDSDRSRRWGKDYKVLCQAWTTMRDMVQKLLMERTTLELVPGSDSINQRVRGVVRSMGPTLFHNELRHQIPVQMFAHITTLHLFLMEAVLEKESSCIYPVLDCLTGLKQVHVLFPNQFDTPPLWSEKGRIGAWVMQLLGRIRPSVKLDVYVKGKPLSVVNAEWRRERRVHGRVVFVAWAEVVRQAFAVDRKDDELQSPAHERPELKENVLVMHPGAYAHEWQAKVVRRQQEWLREQGFEAEAVRLGEADD